MLSIPVNRRLGLPPKTFGFLFKSSQNRKVFFNQKQQKHCHFEHLESQIHTEKPELQRTPDSASDQSWISDPPHYQTAGGSTSHFPPIHSLHPFWGHGVTGLSRPHTSKSPKSLWEEAGENLCMMNTQKGPSRDSNR